MEWIKIDPETDVETVPPQYKDVLFFDKSDQKRKVGKLKHGLWEHGFHYEIEGKQIQDKDKNLTHWQELPIKPEEYIAIDRERQDKALDELLNF